MMLYNFSLIIGQLAYNNHMIKTYINLVHVTVSVWQLYFYKDNSLLNNTGSENNNNYLLFI